MKLLVNGLRIVVSLIFYLVACVSFMSLFVDLGLLDDMATRFRILILFGCLFSMFLIIRGGLKRVI